MVNKICESCKGSNIRSRTNYSHGRGSGGNTTLSCKDCGSYNVKITADSRRHQKRK